MPEKYIGSLTVTLKNKQSYAADSILCPRKGWGADYMQSQIVIVCSGVLTSFDVQDVDSITLNTQQTSPSA